MKVAVVAGQAHHHRYRHRLWPSSQDQGEESRRDLPRRHGPDRRPDGRAAARELGIKAISGFGDGVHHLVGKLCRQRQTLRPGFRRQDCPREAASPELPRLHREVRRNQAVFSYNHDATRAVIEAMKKVFRGSGQFGPEIHNVVHWRHQQGGVRQGRPQRMPKSPSSR